MSMHRYSPFANFFCILHEPSRSYTCTSHHTFRSSFGRTAKFKFGWSAIGAERPILTPTSPITNICSICKTKNISSMQVHSRNEAMQQHCKHENDSVHWYVFRGGDVWKNVPRVTRVGLVIPPPLMLRISRNFSSEEIFWGLPSSPRPKKWVFDI